MIFFIALFLFHCVYGKQLYIFAILVAFFILFHCNSILNVFRLNSEVQPFTSNSIRMKSPCFNAVVKVNPGGQAYDRGSFDHTRDSDNSNSFQHHSDITNGRNIDLLGGILTVKANGRGGILTDNPFLHHNSLVQPPHAGLTLICD